MSVVVLAACASATPPGPTGPVTPEPDASAVEAVLFLVGDAGVAIAEKSPLLAHMSGEVDRWAGVLPDSSVVVAFLGDNVYPVGIRDRNHRDFPQDSARLWSQLRVLDSESARTKGVVGLFTSGNHDWGNMIGEEGRERLANEERMIAEARESGIHVDLLPAGGTPGPSVHDIRRVARLVFIDTHWFLQERRDLWENAFFEGVTQALATSPSDRTIMMAHHPFRSAGPHGALVPAFNAFGAVYLFKKTGTLIQDLNSPRYATFLTRLRTAFAEGGGPPLVFAGGHDHSLQVLSPLQSSDPPHLLVSGAGSKITGVSTVPGLRMAASRPGYMQLLMLRNGDAHLRVVAADERAQHCDTRPANLEACMVASESAFRVVYTETLAPASKAGPANPPRASR